MLDKLLKHKIVKINGVRFCIKKLSPIMFLDKDYLFPMTSIIEKSDKENRDLKEDEVLTISDEFKKKMKDAIEKSVVYIKKSFFSKKIEINYFIKDIMEEPDIYTILFNYIVHHSLDLKKKIFELDRNFAKSLYVISKTYSVLPSELLKLSNIDWCLNNLVTSIGKEEDYRVELMSILNSYNIQINKNAPISTMERMIKQQREKDYGRK